MDTTTTTADLQAGFTHAEEVSARRGRTIDKPFTEDEKIIAACAFEAGARYAREQEGQAVELIDRIISVIDLLLATGNKHLTIDQTPPPFWLADARELLQKRNGGAA